MSAEEILEFLFGQQAKDDLERWGLPPEDDDENC